MGCDIFALLDDMSVYRHDQQHQETSCRSRQGNSGKIYPTPEAGKITGNKRYNNRSDAMRLEIKIKKLPRAKKIAALGKHAGRNKKLIGNKF